MVALTPAEQYPSGLVEDVHLRLQRPSGRWSGLVCWTMIKFIITGMLDFWSQWGWALVDVNLVFDKMLKARPHRGWWWQLHLCWC